MQHPAVLGANRGILGLLFQPASLGISPRASLRCAPAFGRAEGIFFIPYPGLTSWATYPPPLRGSIFSAPQRLRGFPDLIRVIRAHPRRKLLASPAAQGAAERLLQGGFGLVILFRGDFVLGAFGFELEQLFFQRLQQQRRAVAGRSATHRARSAR